MISLIDALNNQKQLIDDARAALACHFFELRNEGIDSERDLEYLAHEEFVNRAEAIISHPSHYIRDYN